MLISRPIQTRPLSSLPFFARREIVLAGTGTARFCVSVRAIGPAPSSTAAMSGETSLAPMVDGACLVWGGGRRRCFARFCVCFPLAFLAPPSHLHTLPPTGTISVITNDGRHVVVSETRS